MLINAFYIMDLTIPLVSNLLKYPYYFWKFESKIKKKNDNSKMRHVELYPLAARSIVKKLCRDVE